MFDSVIFSRGQIVDLERRFDNDSVAFGYSWIIPKYDITFLLRDNSIGIKRYSLNIRLDRYGQILYSNWPKGGYNNKLEFASPAKILQFALKQAEFKRHDTTGYLVDFYYNDRVDKLCWVFKFPKLTELKRDNYDETYNCVEIDWKTLQIISENKAIYYLSY